MEIGRLESRINTLRGQVRRLLAVHGMSWVVALVLPLAVLACVLDWLLHLDGSARLVFLLTLTGVGGWLLYRFVVTPLVVKFADLDIAMRIEERWPGLNDRLASTIQFLQSGAAHDEDRMGSKALRQATVEQTLRETDAIDFREVIEPRPLYRSLVVVTLVLIGACILIAADVDRAGLAARRLFAPFGSDRWPQMTHLTLLERETPRKIAKGEPFTLGVAIAPGETPPSSAKATYTFDDGETVTESLRSVEGGIFRGRIETVEKSFRFSVSAGDDRTSVVDQKVKVVPPPVIDSLAIRIVPPEYTKLPAQTLASDKTQVRAVIGSRVVIEAVANKPIATAMLMLGEKAKGPDINFDTKRTRLSTAFTLKESTPFWLELNDTEGFKNREATRYDARAIRDEAPRVVIDEPTNDRDVTAVAVVPITFTVDDDFGIQSARLLYKVATGGSEPMQEVVLPLWDSSSEADQGLAAVKHKTINYAWDLAPLKLSPGSLITFHADARDFDSIKGPNLGKSRELRLRIVSEEEMRRQLDDAQRVIREDIEAILGMQKQARTPVDEALRSLKSTDQLTKTARDDLKNAEMIQRQVGNRINNKADGLDQKMERFLDDLKNSKIENPDAQKQMQEMRAGVARIRENNLEPAEQAFSRAGKNLDDPNAGLPEKTAAEQDQAPAQAKSREQAQTKSSPASKGTTSKADAKGASPKGTNSPDSGAASKEPAGQAKGAEEKEAASSKGSPKSQKPGESPDSGRKPLDLAKESLAEARENQKEIAEELQTMLDGLSKFETYRGVVKDLKDTLSAHEQVMKQSADTAAKPDLAAKTPEQLSPEQKSDLANLAARQAAVAKKLQEAKEKMEQMADKLKESDPMGAEAMREAAEQVGKQGTSGKIGEAAEQLEKNQMGAARSNQEQARADLKALVDAVQNRRERELAKLIKELKEAEAELKKLGKRQTENLKRTREAKTNPDAKARADQLKKLAKEQAEIQKQTESQLKKLAKANAENAAKAAARASGKMSQAQKNLDQDQGEQAEQQEDDALADLAEAEKEAREARKEAEEQLANEQFAKVTDQIAAIGERQKKVVTDTENYEKLRSQRDGKFTNPQRAGVRNLSAIQEAIKDETGELVEKLEGAPVFALTLKRAGEGMETTSQRLQALKTDELTQRAATSASNRIKQLIESMKADQAKNGQQQQQPPGEGEEQPPSQGGGGGDGIPAAAQVKMLKLLQQEINEKTEYFDELARRKKELTPEQTAELDRLHQDQGTLADLVRDMTKPKKSDAED